jgi:hypothetical protein
MKFLGVSGVFDYAGLTRSSRYRACSCCLPHITRASASGLPVYGAEYPPRLSSVYASLSTSRYPAQDSRPSGSLLLSRKELSSSASCRFSPAHCKCLVTTVMNAIARVCTKLRWAQRTDINQYQRAECHSRCRLQIPKFLDRPLARKYACGLPRKLRHSFAQDVRHPTGTLKTGQGP